MRKKILTIQDISCIGQCSLTVALPVLSCLGIETGVIPTAVLSTHTGMFPGYTYHDLTSQILKIEQHWNKNNIKFDALYTGYLGNHELMDIVLDLYNKTKKADSFLFVDPVMADHGIFYNGFDKEFAKNMAGFCRYADVITPNITESLFLISKYDYIKKYYSEDDIKSILESLCKMDYKNIIITGIPTSKNTLAVACYDYRSNKAEIYSQEYIEGVYHGTGDIFASVASGLILKGYSLIDAAQAASAFVTLCIKHTKDDKEHFYGVHFEECLPQLVKYNK